MVEGGGTCAGGGITTPLSCSSVRVCWSAGRSVSMKVSVGSTRQDPSSTRSSTHADTSEPFTSPPSGTTAPRTTRAGTPTLLASSAITAAYCSSLPTMRGALTKPASSLLTK